jgi:hypothetical protein
VPERVNAVIKIILDTLAKVCSVSQSVWPSPGTCGNTVMSTLTNVTQPTMTWWRAIPNLLAEKTSCAHALPVPNHPWAPCKPDLLAKASMGLARRTMATACLQPQAACIAHLLLHSQHNRFRCSDAYCQPTISACQQWLLRCGTAKRATQDAHPAAFSTPLSRVTKCMPAPPQLAIGGFHTRFKSTGPGT